jgi:hypothetical protein
MLNCPVFLGAVCSDFHACLTRWSGSHWEIGIGGKFFPAVTKVLRCRGSKSISKSSKWKKQMAIQGYHSRPLIHLNTPWWEKTYKTEIMW